MNIMITVEEYNEYEAQKEKIKELEARNEFLKVQYDKLNSLHQETLSEKAALKDENDAQKNEIKDLEELVNCYRQKAIAASGMYHHEHIKNNEYEDLKVKIKHLEDINESLYKDYQQELSIKAALIKERDRLTNVVHKQGSDIVGLRAKLDEAENKDIRFKELVTENYRLKMSINDLRANNKELKKRNEPVASLTITPCSDSEEAYSPDHNKVVKIENLYLTNNYFSDSEEDANDGSKL